MSLGVGVDPVLQWALRGSLALLFLGASWHKLRAPMVFRAALANYQLLPERLLAWAVPSIAGVELAIGVWLVLPGFDGGASLAAAILLSLYTGAIIVNLTRGRREIDCGCSAPGSRRPLSGSLVWRNGVLIGAAGVCTLPVAGRSLIWMDTVSILASVAALGLLYAAIDGSLANAPGRSPGIGELKGRAWSMR